MNSITAIPDFESVKDGDKCRHCGSSKTNIVYEKPPCPHYAAIRCGGCDAFQHWMEHPESGTNKVKIQEILDKLIGIYRLLTTWEYNFVISLKKQKKHSPRQEECLQNIADKYGLNI